MTEQKFSLYVHIPYCAKKCPYCDFNSYGIGLHPTRETLPEESYTEALLLELDYAAESPFWNGRRVATVFFGGGTPSIFSGNAIAKILQHVRDRFHPEPEWEVTLEANPGTIDETLGLEKLRAFLGAGVNRLSFGVQSFRAEKLHALGRIHSGDDAERAVHLAQEAGFANFNCDLIFGVRGETSLEWRTDLERMFRLSPPHLSAYSLTVEPGTEFGRLSRKGIQITCDEENQAELFEMTAKVASDNGYQQYEVSNFAKPGHECRHNLNYWSYGDYLGIGAGAHSFVSGDRANENGSCGARWINTMGPGDYIQRVERDRHAEQRRETLTVDQARMEFLYATLRTVQGADLKDYQRRFGHAFVSDYRIPLTELAGQNVITISEERAVLTPRGLLFADEVISTLVRDG